MALIILRFTHVIIHTARISELTRIISLLDRSAIASAGQVALQIQKKGHWPNLLSRQYSYKFYYNMPRRNYKPKNRSQGRNPNHRSGVRQNYEEPVKENGRFEGYYNRLGILSEDEKTDFWNAMRRELPNSFRFAGSKGYD